MVRHVCTSATDSIPTLPAGHLGLLTRAYWFALGSKQKVIEPLKWWHLNCGTPFHWTQDLRPHLTCFIVSYYVMVLFYSCAGLCDFVCDRCYRNNRYLIAYLPHASTKTSAKAS